MQTVALLDHTPETVVILGGGPAGISCALWLKNLGHHPIILESGSETGGTPGQIDRPNRWIAGMPEITSLGLAQKLQEQCTVSDLQVLTEVKVLSVCCAESHNFKVTYSTTDGTAEIGCAAIIFATGVRPRSLESVDSKDQEIQSEYIELDPLGHLTGRTSHDGERSLVVGGADNAFFTANDLVISGANVTLACRSLPKAQSLIQSQIKSHVDSGKLRVIQGSPSSFRQTGSSLEVEMSGSSDSFILEVDKVYLRLGFTPRFEGMEEILKNLKLPTDQQGFPQLDSEGRWCAQGIYCCGDLNRHEVSAVVSSLAGGAQVAKTVEYDLRRSK